jgi:hypothetical protein
MEPRLEAAIPAARKLRRACCPEIDLQARVPEMLERARPASSHGIAEARPAR